MLSVRTGLATYNGKLLSPRLDWGYDTWEARQARSDLLDAYVDGTVYSSEQPFSESLKAANRLYRFIRDTHSPVKIATDLIAANVYQGTVDYRNLSTGALPFQYDNKALEEPLRLTLRSSNFGQQLGAYTRDAAVKGDGVWWVVDDPDSRRIRIELIDPLTVRHKESDEAGNVKACVLEYDVEDPLDLDPRQFDPKRLASALQKRKTRTHTLTVDQDWFTRYIDGAQVARWPNIYGLVPLKCGSFEKGPGEWGKSAFYASLGKINEINDAQALLNDTIRRVIEPLLVAKNITAETTVTPQRDERTGIITLYIQSAPGVEAEIVPLTIPVDVAAASANIDRLERALERDLPILALPKMREMGERVTGPGVQAGLSDAIGMIQMARKSLDTALVGAVQIAITMGAVRGYDGYRAFSLNSYDRGEMELALKERPVIADQLTKDQLLTYLLQLKDQPPGVREVAMKLMGMSQDDSAAILDDAALTDDLTAILNGAAGGNDRTNPAARPADAAVPALPGNVGAARA